MIKKLTKNNFFILLVVLAIVMALCRIYRIIS